MLIKIRPKVRRGRLLRLQNKKTSFNLLRQDNLLRLRIIFRTRASLNLVSLLCNNNRQHFSLDKSILSTIRTIYLIKRTPWAVTNNCCLRTLISFINPLIKQLYKRQILTSKIQLSSLNLAKILKSRKCSAKPKNRTFWEAMKAGRS
jgi:hypothetical protein